MNLQRPALGVHPGQPPHSPTDPERLHLRQPPADAPRQREQQLRPLPAGKQEPEQLQRGVAAEGAWASGGGQALPPGQVLGPASPAPRPQHAKPPEPLGRNHGTVTRHATSRIDGWPSPRRKWCRYCAASAQARAPSDRPRWPMADTHLRPR